MNTFLLITCLVLVAIVLMSIALYIDARATLDFIDDISGNIADILDD